MQEEPMGLFFTNDLHDEFGTWPLAYIRYGGLDAGEILAVANRVGDGDDSAFHAAWMAMGEPSRPRPRQPSHSADQSPHASSS
jgi:hypothetical protein